MSAAAAPDLSEFYNQQVQWQPCGEGELAKLQCAAVVVPMNYRKPDAERISVVMSKLPAKDPAKRRGVLLLNPGGPGAEGVSLPLLFEDRPITQSYDLIGFDPRGVGRSTPLRCEVAPSVGTLSSRPSDAEFAVWAAQARAEEEGCERAAGGLRPYINTPNTARDMDVIRGVLGEAKINYLGFSYGTYLGAVYGSLFAKNLDRNVLDSAVHPEWIWREQFRQQAIAIRSNVDEFTAWVGQRDKTYGLGKSAAEVLATSEALAAKLAVTPIEDPTFGRVDRTIYDLILGANARYRPLWDALAELVVTFKAAVESKLAAGSPELIDALKAAKVLYDMAIPPTVDGVFTTVTCEAPWPKDLNTYYSDMRVFREKYPYGFGVLRVAPWNCTFSEFKRPDKLTDLRRTGYPTGLVIQAEADPQTHYDGGPALAAKLNDHLVSVPDDGTHGLYISNACSQAIIDNYLINGVLPGTRVVCPGDPRPNVPADTEATAGRPLGTGESLESTVRDFVAEKKVKTGS
ncbi:alpha/beta fold hydrolase [Kibdelosporangium persicum]|nr:alpha/beta fold hydrolase [Kibdelosporangium persicum]